MNNEQLHAMRHSLAHITATARSTLMTEAKFMLNSSRKWFLL